MKWTMKLAKTEPQQPVGPSWLKSLLVKLIHSIPHRKPQTQMQRFILSNCEGCTFNANGLCVRRVAPDIIRRDAPNVTLMDCLDRYPLWAMLHLQATTIVEDVCSAS